MIVAYGAEKVRALELTLGGKPPKQSRQHAASELHRYVQEEFERRKLMRTKMNALLTRQRELLSKITIVDKSTEAYFEELRRKRKKRPQPSKPRKRAPHPKIEPRMVAGSGFWLKVPPYDNQLWAAEGEAEAAPDALNGTYVLNMAHSSSAYAALEIDFYAIEDNPFQRFAAVVDYDYNWYDESNLWAPATNYAETRIWVWGNTENRWVWQQGGFSPNWNDSINNFQQSNGSGGDGSDQFGTESLEVFFPAFGNNWYQVWIWSIGSCGDLNSLPSWSWAWQYQNMQIPFVVFGSLF
jgi:hypothetical protein